jgi:hypothetical protein
LFEGLEVFNGNSYLAYEAILPTRKKRKGKKVVFNQTINYSAQVQSKKTCQPNWEHGEVLTLVKAKGDEHIANFDIVDRQDKFKTMVTKWNKILAQVMNARCLTHLRNGVACKDKDKSCLITKELKEIFDYKQELDITKITNL